MANALIKILLVEDNDIDIKAITRALQHSRIPNPLLIAHDGIEALDLLRGSNGDGPLDQPYLVLLDLNMPRMDGIEFLEELRNDEKLRRSIVFVLTTSEDERDIAAAYDKQVAGYLSKCDVGGSFRGVINLIEQFQSSVHFPPAT